MDRELIDARLIELSSQKSYLDILNIFKENKHPFDFTEYNREFGSHILDISKKTPIDQVRYIEDEYWFRIGQRPWDRLPLSGIAITIGYMYKPNYRYKKYILYDRIEIIIQTVLRTGGNLKYILDVVSLVIQSKDMKLIL